MRPQWLVWLVFTYMIGQMMCFILEGSWFGGQEQSLMNALTGFSAHSYTDSAIGNIGTFVTNVVGGTFGLFTYALPRLLLWDYSFLEGGWSVVKWVVLYPINAGTVLGIISLFKR